MSHSSIGVGAIIPGATALQGLGPDTTIFVMSSSAASKRTTRSSTVSTRVSSYEVRFFQHKGEWELSCTCQAWKYQKREIWLRSCKHTKQVHNSLCHCEAEVSWYFANNIVVAEPSYIPAGTFALPDDLPDWAR